MLKKCVAGMAVAVCMTAAMQLHLEAQGRGGRAGRGGEAADPTKVEAAVNMHAQGLQDDFAQLETIRRNPNGPHPYLYGPERFGRFMSIMAECGRARLAAMGEGV